MSFRLANVSVSCLVDNMTGRRLSCKEAARKVQVSFVRIFIIFKVREYWCRRPVIEMLIELLLCMEEGGESFVHGRKTGYWMHTSLISRSTVNFECLHE
jgi:hypothetical protein